MKRVIASALPLLAFTVLTAPMAQAASSSSFSQSKAEEGGELLSPRHIDGEKQLSERFEEEFYEGLGNKSDSSSRILEEFYEGLGNKGDSSSRTREEFYEGLGNKGDSSSRTREEFYEGLGNKTSLS